MMHRIRNEIESCPEKHASIFFNVLNCMKGFVDESSPLLQRHSVPVSHVFKVRINTYQGEIMNHCLKNPPQ